jgi:RHS repeat-associated protein
VDQLGAETVSAPVTVTVGPQPKGYFIHADHLNTPRAVYDDQQQLRWSWEQQEPFGVNVPDENPNGLGVFEFPARFPGQYADKETNLSHNIQRNFAAEVGRYVETDPLGVAAGSTNLYVYVDSDPIGAFDDLGLQTNKPALPKTVTKAPVVTTGGSNTVQGSGGSGAISVPNFAVQILNPGGGCDPCKARTSGGGGPSAPQGPNFVVTSKGQAIPIPTGATGPVPNFNRSGNVTGWAFTGGAGGTGLSPTVSSVRIMNPTQSYGPSPGYPGGYVNYTNQYGQSINPYTGQTVSKNSPWWHIPLICTP